MNSDVANSPELTSRQKHILEMIIRGYIQQAKPIGSKSLVEHLGVSSATIRNEMSILEDVGLIRSPHTSAGRVPTEAGYRYFVQRLLGQAELGIVDRRMIAHQFHQAPLELDQWMRLATAVLAHTSQNISLITAPSSHINQFKHLELIETQGRLVLMVLVLQNGDVRQRMLSLAEPVPQETLSEVAARITHLGMGLTAQGVREKMADLPVLEQEVIELVASLLAEANKPDRQIAYRDGLAGLIDQFEESEGVEQALRVLEEQAMLENLLEQSTEPSIGSIRVVIAGEGRWDDISLLSIVLGQYGVPGQATGMLGVLGPTRMPYGRVISAVRYVADLMSGLLIGIYGNEPPKITM